MEENMLKKFSSLLLVFALLLSFTTGSFVMADTNVVARSIKLNNGSNLYLEVGDVKTLPVTFNPENATNTGITFSSSDKSIVSIDKTGTVKALKTGKVTLTAEMDGKQSSIYATVYVNNNIKAAFTETIAVKDKIKNISINVSSKDTDVKSFYIYLPSGYLVEGASATYAADKNGTYPFTVYDNTGTKKTFYYEVKGIKEPSIPNSQIDDLNKSDFDIDVLYSNLNLQYDYEKKQCLFNAPLDKIRTVKLPNNTVIDTNEINYYISNINSGNGVVTSDIYNYTFEVEDKELKVKLIRQGEFYLLIIWQESDRDARNVLVTYRAYNFTTSQELKTNPDMDYITDNGSYEILAYSDSGIKELFNFNVKDIDFVRPYASISITYEDKLELIAKDDRKLDYIITYDGKYIKVPDNYGSNTEYLYKHPDTFKYNGEYIFVCVDTSGNRTVVSAEITTGRHVLYTKKLSPNIHNSAYTKSLFSNIGDEYYYRTDSNIYYKNTFPAYMRGITETKFSPNATMTRAQIVTILCRVTDLPYDITLSTKTKFTDINNHWAKHYISMASTKRYIQGYKDKSFKPNDILTRADFCKMINDISTLKTKIANIPAVYNYAFSDIDGQYSYAKADILKLANRGIINTNGDKFKPGTPITRAEVIYAINRLYGLSPSENELAHIKKLYNQYYSFNDIKNSPYYNDILISIMGMYREEKK